MPELVIAAGFLSSLISVCAVQGPVFLLAGTNAIDWAGDSCSMTAWRVVSLCICLFSVALSGGRGAKILAQS